MTTLEARPGTTHPLEMTTTAEVDRVREALAAAGLLGDTVRFAFFAPEEPPKDAVLAHRDGGPVDRRFRAVLLDLATGRSWDTVVSATRGEVDSSRELDPPRDGQPPIIDAEFEFRDGKILRHRDRFDFHRWSRQALGTSGLLLGWTPLLRNKVRSTARGSLEKFMQERGVSGP